MDRRQGAPSVALLIPPKGRRRRQSRLNKRRRQSSRVFSRGFPWLCVEPKFMDFLITTYDETAVKPKDFTLLLLTCKPVLGVTAAMSNSQEQSLSEDVVFSPVYESNAQFLHCERERRALECLLREGTGPYRTKLNQERLGAFLSPEEVAQFCQWAQDYHSGEASQEHCEREEDCKGARNLSIRYWPTHTDLPLPSLQLGWPERESWPDTGNTVVYISPPVEGAPPIREVVRRMIQGAQTLIAVVTDRLTDGAVINDLRTAASRGVPVYIILNKRSVHDSCTSPGLNHEKIRVRILGGKTFRSRDGRMVVGELKENFLLVDLEAVMVGSYSLTWADAHLHRQLVTVLSGPVVSCFDQEFRVLYAESLPIPESCWAHRSHMRMENAVFHPEHIVKPSDWHNGEDLTPPPVGSLIDWEALGVIKRDKFPDDPLSQPSGWDGVSEPPSPSFEKQTPVEMELPARRAEFQRYVPPAYVEHNRKQQTTKTYLLPDNEPTPRKYEPAFKTHFLPENEPTFRKYEAAPKTHLLPENDPTTRITAKLEGYFYRPYKSFTEIDEKRFFHSHHHKTYTQPAEKFNSSSSGERNEENGMVHSKLRRDSNPELGMRPQLTEQGRGNRSPKKPLILMVPVSENDDASELSNVLKNFKTPTHSQENHLRSNPTPDKGVSMSMQDLSLYPTETDDGDKTIPSWRRKASGYGLPHQTPAQALMKNRTDEVKTTPPKPQKTYTPLIRPHSFGFTGDWGRLQQNRSKDQGNPLNGND
ncbi:hypothetical protein AGOR_G00154170 [Albula goreensis]|uniref:Scaffolding anchor of CK1 domain-containing protein n=1 Tax=Albula goreensis TaxID=1534307 RepID=A0A8T3CYT6_9TELE|nr:hypothetical protein AGOR_G00154170 [Albula goreensis]